MCARGLAALGIILVTITPATGWTQIIEPRRVFGRYQQFVWNDQYGLPQNTVSAMTHTRDGYLWLGTVEGAARFDGTRFTVFSRSNTPALRDSYVKALLEDRDGALWLGTQAGIVRVKDGRFTSYTRDQGLTDDDIQAIVEDADGAVWFGTYRGGVLRFADGQFTAFTTAQGLPHNEVSALTRDSAGRVWIGTAAGLAVRDGQHFTTYTRAEGLPDDTVWTLHSDREGALWVGTARGVTVLRGNRFVRPQPLAQIGSAVSALLEDRAGALWVGTRDLGVYRYAAGRLTSYRATDGLPGDYITSLYQDPDGDIWIGTYGWGVVQLREPRVETVTTQNGLPHNTVRAVLEDQSGAVWIGTDSGLTRIVNGTSVTYSSSDGLVGGVNALGQDQAGEIWVGMWRGISRVRRGRLELVPELATQDAEAMLTGRAGDFWIATHSNGLYRTRDGRVENLTVEDGLPSNEVIALYEDSAGAIWIGTPDRGMSRLAQGGQTTWTMREGLASNHVLSFCEDSAGTIWIGTHGGGLHRFKDGRFSVITTGHGLYDNLAFRVVDDGLGNLWMLSNRGIYRATLQSLNDVADGRASVVSSFAYGVADGMLSREGNGGGPAATRARDGRIWFATMGGAVAIDPRVRNERPPMVAIEGVTIDRVETQATDAIEMTPRQQNLEIHYTGLSWRRPHQIRFRYRLVGLDRDWVEAGSRRTAYYSYLPPGRHTFQVIADNGDGVWNMEGRTLAVIVVPAFYQRWWFSLLIVGLVGIVAAATWRYQIGHVRERQAAQQAFARQLIASQEAERKRIAAELHDGLGQHLVVIKNLALLTMNQGADESERQQRIESIADGASQAMREVREISHNLRPYQLDRLGLTMALQGIVKAAAAGSPVDFTTAIENVDEVLPKEAEINLYRVVQESVNNILKHAQASTASVVVRRHGRRLRVTIADDGRGFMPATSPSDARHGGFGLLGMSERVRLLGGTMRVDSAPGHGTTMSIEIEAEGGAHGL